MIKSNLPNQENKELAKDLLDRFPSIDHSQLLIDLVAKYFYWYRHGNKREERMACDFLNELQALASKQESK